MAFVLNAEILIKAVEIFEIKKRLSELLPKERYVHSLAVEKVAQELALHYRTHEEKAAVAGLLHDCSRRYDGEELVKKAEEAGLHLDPVQRFEPKLIHAPLSAYIAKEEFGVSDPEILLAIERHTVGAEDMSDLEKIIYLADHIEPGRDYDGVDIIRDLAFKNMDEAIAQCTGSMIKELLERGLPIYPLTVRTRNFYLLKTLKRKKEHGR